MPDPPYPRTVLACRSSGSAADSPPEPSSGPREGLEAGGLALVEVTSVERAIDALELDAPSAVIVIAGDPIEAMGWLIALRPRMGDLPCLVATDAAHSDQVSLFDAGAFDLLSPDVDGPQTVQRLKNAIQLRNATRSTARTTAEIRALQEVAGAGLFEVSLIDASLRPSAEAARALGLPASGAPLAIESLLEGASVEHEAQVREGLEVVLEGERPSALALVRTGVEGIERRVRIAAAPRDPALVDTIVCAVRTLGSALDAGDLEQDADETDPITGLPNRKQFLRTLEAAIQASRDESEQLAVLFVEVDVDPGAHGVKLDDQERDQLLAVAVQRIRESIRGMDSLAQSGSAEDLGLSRFGNDALTVLLREQTKSQDAFRVARRLREGAEPAVVLGNRDVPIALNVGIAIHPGDAQTPASLVKCAEEAMYCAKQQGRNNIQFYTSSMNTATFEALTLESSLRRALEHGELLVYYQPKVELATNRIVGMEALVRWRHPEMGLVSPAQFIPVAEETGLIIPIGEFVLETACLQNKAWQESGLDPIRMAVNISGIQFRRPDLFDTVVGVLDRTRLEAEWLELEITEGILLRNVDATISTLNKLKRAGIHLSIDDFGTGYSSLSYLKRFPVDTLKVDQSFIREVTTSPDDASITTSIILMGHSLKMKVIAEGVETKSQLAFLRVLECDEVQGYYYSPPVPADKAGELLAKPFPIEA